MSNQALTIYQLLPIQEDSADDGTIQTVDARDLHVFLESRRQFADWIKDRISEFNFLENQDFVIFSQKSDKQGRPSVDYHLTLDMAKQLAMVERNEKGREARLYFIECEKQLKSSQIHLTRQEYQHLVDRISKLEEDNKLLEDKTDNNWDWIQFIHGQDPSELGLTRNLANLVIKHHEYFFETIDALTALEDRIDYIARLAPGRGKHKRVSDFLRKGPKPT